MKQPPRMRNEHANPSHQFQQAIQLHQRGNLDQAGRLYSAILATQSNCFDAMHLLGVLRYQQCRNVEALYCIGAALKMKPTDVAALSNFGLVHERFGHPEDALASYDKALALKPDYVEALNNRGNALIELRRPEEALANFDRALAIKPDFAEALSNRGNALRDIGRYVEALASYDRALALKPDFAEALNNRGNALRNLKRSDEALASYDRAIALRPDYPQALVNRGDVLIELGRPEEALAAYDRVLAIRPDFVEVLANRGNVLIGLGRPDEALASYDKALAIRPDFVEVLTNRGNVLVELGRPKEALATYDRVLALKPDFAEALNNRGNALRDLKRSEEALASYDRAIALKPDYVEALNNCGNVLMDLRCPREALASYDRAIALKPNYAEAFANRGDALRDLKRSEEALASFDRAIALKPDYAEAFVNRGNTFIDLQCPAAALASYDRAIALKPDYAEALNNRGNALRELERSEEALASFDRAIALKPDYAVAYGNKAITLTELGRFKEASDATERAIELAPKKARSYYNLAISKRLAPGDPHIRAMEELAQDMASLSSDEQIDLHFALGKAFADINDQERSFRHLLDGNALKRRQSGYDEAATLGAMERTRAVFCGDLMRHNEGLGEPSSAPVFILGMPRSGSTLVEQILASHPKVFGAGEINDFNNVMMEVGFTSKGALHFPEVVALASGEQLHRLGETYMERIRALAPAAERITNKTPGNFLFTGLIHLALPNARVIHTRRDPVDTCLSCFSTLFAKDLSHTYDLEELGRYYRAYETLMAHWRSVLPQNVLLELQYEEVVADLEGQARRVIAHCGLEWDARCLDFHRTERPVRTASMTQVRQPIYKSSVGRWRALEPFLGPLLTGLELSDLHSPR